MSLVANLLQTTAMTIARPLAGLFGVAGTLVQSISDRFDDLLSSEETAGNDNVFYNPQDLTSLRVGRDGSGGVPVVGDPVGMMLDTSGLSGSMEEFLAAQPELVTNGTFDTASDWTVGTGWSINSGVAAQDGTGGDISQNIGAVAGKVYQVSFDLLSSGPVFLRFYNYPQIFVGGAGTKTYILPAISGSSIAFYCNPGVVVSIDNISVKEIPGNHAIAPTDAARPTLMDDPDTTWSSLTDDGTRGEDLKDSGVLTVQTGWTNNGDGSYTANATSYNGVYWSGLPLDVGSEYDIEFTVDSYTSGVVYAFLGSSGHTVIGPISATGTFSGTYRFSLSSSPTLIIRANPNFVGTISNISIRKVNTAFDERGDELVVSPDFSDAGQWSLDAGWSITGGVLIGSAPGSFSNATPTKTEATATDDALQITVTIDSCDDFLEAGLLYGPSVRNFQSIGVTAPGTYTFNVIAGTSSTKLYVRSANITVSQFSVKRILTPNLLLGYNTDDDSTFDTDTGNWTKGTGWSIGSGVASCDGTQVSTSALAIPITMTANKFYKAQVYISSISAGSIDFRIGAAAPGTAFSATGWHTFIARYTSGSNFNIFASTDFVGSIDNVSLQELPSTTPTSYYLDTNGTDDWMQVTPTLNLGEQWWHTGAWISDGSGGKRPFGTSNNYQGAPRDISGDWVWYDPSSVAQIICTSDPSASKHVLTIEQSDTNGLSARFNGVQEADPITPYDDSGVTQGLALFSQQNNLFANGWNGRFYGGAWGQGQVDYDELTTLQDYLGTLVEPDINPTDVTSYANVYEMLSAQTAAALFDIDDTTSLRTVNPLTGNYEVPVDGDPVDLMMDVSGAGGSTMAAYLEGATELVTNGTFDTDTSGWTGVNATLSIVSGVLRVTSTSGGSYARLDSFAVEVGKVYRVSADVSNIGGTKAQLWVGSGYNLADWLLIDNVTTASTISGVFTATSANAYLELVGTTATGQSIDWDNISVKPLPGYVATAASDPARPTLASVLDETASELTDDGTRGDELVDYEAGTTSGSVTASATQIEFTDSNYAAWTTDRELEIGAEYEWTLEVLNVSAAGNLRLKFGTENVLLRSGVSTPSTYTGTQRYRGTGAFAVDKYASVNTFQGVVTLSVRKVNTVFDGRGDELVTNGDFSDGSTGWTHNNTSGTSTFAVAGGEATFTRDAFGDSFYQTDVAPAVAGVYLLTFDITAISGGGLRYSFSPNSAANPSNQVTVSSVGSYSTAFVSDGTLLDFVFDLNANGASVTIDNISVKEVLTPNLLLTSAGDDDSTFDTDTGNWNKGTGWTISGGTASHTGNAGSFQQSTLVEQYKWYALKFYVSSISGGNLFVRIGDPSNNDLTVSTTGWHEVYAQADGTYLNFFASTGVTVDIDNVIIQEVPASVARAFYLDFDGLDDNLILDGTDFGSSTNATLYKTFRGDSTDTQHVMFAPGASGSWALAAQSGSGSIGKSQNLGTPVFRQDGAVKTYTTWGNVFTELIDNTDHTIGVEEADLSVTVTWASSGFSLSSDYGTAYITTGRLYSWAAVDTRLDGRNRDLLENFMISKKTS